MRARLTAVGLGAVLAVGAGAGSAQAVTGYHTSASGVRVRAGASTATAQISYVPTAGTAIDIACQIPGQSVTASGFGTSTVWDRLNGYGNGYISDLFVQETPYAQFDPRLPRCDAPPPLTFSISQTTQVHGARSINAATVTSTIGAGSAVTIQCQTYGTRLGGSFVWDRIAAGYVSDVYVNGTPFNAFDSRLSRCGDGYQPVDCSKVLFLGARGSGEPLGGTGSEHLGEAGSPVQETRNKLAAYGANLDVAGTIYPAQDVSILLSGDLADYFAGEADGVRAMLNDLRSRTNGNVCG
jgi:hypothetical protein